MRNKNRKWLAIAISSLATFFAWTVLLRTVDVRAIGPDGTSVGFATFNELFRDLIGVRMSLYVITDWLGVIPIFVALCFAVVGCVQLVQRKSFLKVDRSIVALGIFYVVVVAVYVFFENVIINYRPILIDGYLEASYPSSTTMLVMCVMPTALIQLRSRIKNITFRKIVAFSIIFFIGFMVIGRVLSGVHWISDIIGGAMFSTGVVALYNAFGRFELK